MASGRLRIRDVEISGTVFLPLSIPQKIAECFELTLRNASAIIDPFEQAFFVMVHLPYLQPFEDVNKRVSRLAANIPLIQKNLCPLSFIDVPDKAYIEGTLGVYELQRPELLRDVFVWAYERSCQRYLAIRQSLGEPDAFRLKHRAMLIDAVQFIVRSNLRGTDEEIADFAAQHITG
jgi:Fic/DOC family